MLGELHIRNFAVIKDIAMHFVPGLNVISGEEGTGKSLLVDALGLLMGARAPSGLIRTGTRAARIEAILWPEDATLDVLKGALEETGIEPEANGMILISRDFQEGGKSVARVNNRAVPLSMLKQLGRHMVDIHGQMEYLSLLDTANQLTLVDVYGGLLPLRAEVRKMVEAWRQREKELSASVIQEKEGYVELLQYQVEEIEKAGLSEINEEELYKERDILRRAEAISRSCLGAYAGLYADEGSVAVLMHRILTSVRSVCSLDDGLAQCRERLESNLIGIEETAHELRAFADRIDDSQDKLMRIEEKIDLLLTLKRKYGSTIDQIIAFGERAKTEIESLQGRIEQRQKLEEERLELKAKAAKKAEDLSLARRDAAGKLVRIVNAELAELGLEWAKFDILITRREDADGVVLAGGKACACTLDGIDRLDFQVATNPGEPMRSMAAIASGGETSRIVLAVKSALKAADPIPTLVFDEIDMGVGGRSADSVGRKLASLANFHQVLCITHLPQIACFGDMHFKLVKEIESGRAASKVETVEGADKIRELAAMLGAERNGNAMVKSAEALVRNAEKWKNGARELVAA